jgi:hypothetical protein
MLGGAYGKDDYSLPIIEGTNRKEWIYFCKDLGEAGHGGICL